MSDVWIVMGSTGEYSDRSEWPVAWYATEKEAEYHSDRAAEEAKRVERERDDRYSAPKGSNKYDPDMSMDYTGTGYYVMRVPKGSVSR